MLDPLKAMFKRGNNTKEQILNAVKDKQQIFNLGDVGGSSRDTNLSFIYTDTGTSASWLSINTLSHIGTPMSHNGVS